MVALARTPDAPPPCRRGQGIAVWHVVISGFTQTLQKPSGCQQLWDAIRRTRSGCEAPVLLQPWNSDWSGLAELIWRFRPLDRPSRVYCYGYSWGGGSVPRFARELLERGIEIEHAVLCDAVYRPRLRVLSPLALCPWPKIFVPPNVRRVSWFFQRTSLPAGHQVVAENPQRTEIDTGVEVRGVSHHYMDDQNCWWLKSLDVASSARPADLFEFGLNRLQIFPMRD